MRRRAQVGALKLSRWRAADMSGNPYYFAYGSNLNSDDWQDWCRRAGYRADLLQPLRTGWLVDHHPIYHYRSSGRRGGALDITPTIGHLTPGVLFRVGEDAWSALDAKEGRRVTTTANR